MDLNNQPIRQNNNQPQRNQYLSTSIKQRKTTSRVHVVREANSFNSKNIKTFLSVLIIGGLFAIPLVVVLLIGAFFGYYQVSGRIIPGVKIASSDVGGMLITEAALELEKTWNLDNQIVISSGLNTLVVKPSDLGLRLDPLASVQKAYHIGHKDTIVDRFGHLTISLTQGWQITPVIHFDKEKAREGLENINIEMSIPPKDASLHSDGSQLIAIPGEIGYTFNVDETIEMLEKNPIGILQTRILTVQLIPIAPQISDLSAMIVPAEELINHPASFRAYDALKNESIKFSIPKETLAYWIKLEMNDQEPVISLDENRIKESLKTWQENLGDDRYFDGDRYSSQISEAVLNKQVTTIPISHPQTNYTVQPGDTLLKIGWKLGIPYWKIIQANPNINPDKLLMGSVLTIPSKDELLPLPVVENKRIIISIKKQRLWVYQNGDLLSEHIISTGVDRSPTQPGIFQVQTHVKNAYASVWDLHMPHFLGIYEAWPGFMNGIHGLPTLSNGQRLWASILGKPASYGCIILNLEDAKWLYEWAEAGVVVEINP